MKTVIEMAREAELQTDSAGVWVDDGYITNQLERFAELVRADEREACAKEYEELAENAIDAIALRFQQIATAIRARGNT